MYTDFHVRGDLKIIFLECYAHDGTLIQRSTLSKLRLPAVDPLLPKLELFLWCFRVARASRSVMIKRKKVVEGADRRSLVDRWMVPQSSPPGLHFHTSILFSRARKYWKGAAAMLVVQGRHEISPMPFFLLAPAQHQLLWNIQ